LLKEESNMLRIVAVAAAACLMTTAAKAGYATYQECIEHQVLSKNLIVAVQEALKKAGVYSGKADGEVGKGTREAIRKRSKQLGLADSDRLSLPFLQAVLEIDSLNSGLASAKQFCDRVMPPRPGGREAS
jgi:lysozyme family protein